MTGVADTRLLLALEFPPKEEVGLEVRDFFEKELTKRILVPSIVLTEFVKIAGSKIGADAAKNRIRLLKDKGIIVTAIDEETALIAGCLLLSNQHMPISDALIASFVKKGVADYVITDDPHFKTLGVKSKWI